MFDAVTLYLLEVTVKKITKASAWVYGDLSVGRPQHGTVVLPSQSRRTFLLRLTISRMWDDTK
jgi:hypothetical protein